MTKPKTSEYQNSTVVNCYHVLVDNTWTLKLVNVLSVKNLDAHWDCAVLFLEILAVGFETCFQLLDMDKNQDTLLGCLWAVEVQLSVPLSEILEANLVKLKIIHRVCYFIHGTFRPLGTFCKSLQHFSPHYIFFLWRFEQHTISLGSWKFQDVSFLGQWELGKVMSFVFPNGQKRLILHSQSHKWFQKHLSY